ncbi:MAG: hypothetical protein NXH78_05000 [Hyphomonadaceae bacterium]|nr:hypothetical protein [Hyphomonadaceae bacterium]
MIEEEKTAMDRVARVWLTFILFGGIIGIGLFLGLVFGLRLGEGVSTVIAMPVGILLGFGLARLSVARRLATRLLSILSFIRWHTS